VDPDTSDSSHGSHRSAGKHGAQPREATRAREALDPTRADGRAALRPWLELQRHLALKPERAVRALAAHGDPARALRQFCPGATPLSDRSFEVLCARLGRVGVVGLPWGHPDYPEGLVALSDAPFLLWVRGGRDFTARPAVAIIGARAATGYGRRVAHSLARDLAARDVLVVSGLARGIDAAAHRGALETGATLAVLPCGPDLIYPRSHRELAGQIVGQGGSLVAEFAPGTPPLRYHFPFRNRIISGLCAAVVVVEARARSGSLLTVDHALRQGREVLAVPGPVDAANSEGPNLLLRAGAAPVLDVSDVFAAAGLPAAPLAHRDASRPGADTVHPMLAALQAGPASPDELVAKLDADAATVARELVRLELEGSLALGADGRAYATSLSSRPSGGR